jgi:invasion protein IalB
MLVKTSYRVIVTFIVLCFSGVVYSQAPSTGNSEEPPQLPVSNWTHECDKKKRCFVYSDGATRLVFSKKRGKSNKSMRASVILPLGVEVGSPVTLHIGAKRNLMLNVTTCNEKLCEAQIKEQYAMKLAEQLVGEPSLEVATSTGGVIAIESISLSGYVGEMYKM